MVDLHREWALTLAYVRGHQNVNFSSLSKRWYKNKRNDWQSRLVTNLMLPLVKAKVAKFSIAHPIWDVIPATPDQEDIEIARVSSKILQDAWVKQNMTQKLVELITWVFTIGNGFLKVGWDNQKGEEREIDPRSVEEQTLDEYLYFLGMEVVPETVKVKTGELAIEVPSPFSITAEPLVTRFEDSKYVIETTLQSKDKLVERFGNRWKDKLTETTDTENLITPFTFAETNEKIERKGVITRELFIEKGGKFKRGLYCLTAGDEYLIPPQDLPYDHGKKPYVHFLEIFDPVSMWGHSSAQAVRPNQVRYNKLQSVVTDHINLVGKVPWMIPYSSGVKRITNKPGENIFYNGPRPPEQGKISPLPAYIENAIERTRRDIQDVSSHHNVSQAQSEPGLRSGRAILALQDADDQIDGATLQWYRRSLEDVGKLVIQTINQYVTQDEVIRVRGEFNELETMTYNGTMLKGKNQGDYYDVRAKIYNNQLLSRSGREDQILRFMEIGIIHPQMHQEVILEMLGSANVDMIYDEEEADRVRQWDEIKLMLEGQQVPVITGENHEAHLRMIKKFYASGKRDKATPEALAAIQEHYLQHKQMQVAELVQDQMIIQGALGGQGQGTGTDGSNGKPGGKQQSASRAGQDSRNTGVNTTA